MDSKYLRSLDGVRAVAFLIVFFSHAGYQKVPGGLGVTVFFFLSGFLITSLLRKEYTACGTISLYGFYRRRMCRILPPLYCVLIVTTLLDRFDIPSHEVSWGGLFSIIFYYFNYAVLLYSRSGIHVASGMGVLWSLMIEEHFYMVFPVVYLAMLRKKLSPQRQSWLLALVCCAVMAWRIVLVFVVRIDLNAQEIWTYSATDTRFDSILWGCIMAIYANPWCDDKTGFLNRYKASLATSGVALVFITFLVRNPQMRETIRYTLQGIGLFPVFYYVIAAPKSWLVKILEWNPLRWLGSVSYTMYLIHYFMIGVFEKFFPAHRMVSLLLAFTACAVFGWGLRRIVEIPFRNYGRSRRFTTANAVPVAR